MADNIDRVPLKESVRNKLWRIGLGTFKALEAETCETLAAKLEIDQPEAALLTGRFVSFNLRHLPEYLQPVSALDLLNQKNNGSLIKTGSSKLDEILCGGIGVGKLTEFFGVPGVGKTQLCLQLCINVQLPVEHGGLEGSAVWIDTDGGVSWNRVKHLANFAIRQASSSGSPIDWSADDFLRRIYFFRCTDYFEVLTTVHLIRELVLKDARIKLIVLDSIATHFRYAFDDLSRRAKMLNSVTHLLSAVAIEQNLAVVLTNQMTTRVAVEESQSTLIPALGLSFGHASAVRVYLYWDNGKRMAKVVKSPMLPETDAVFQITRTGICDVNEENLGGLSALPPSISKAPSGTTPTPMCSQFAELTTEEAVDSQPSEPSSQQSASDQAQKQLEEEIPDEFFEDFDHREESPEV